VLERGVKVIKRRRHSNVVGCCSADADGFPSTFTITGCQFLFSAIFVYGYTEFALTIEIRDEAVMIKFRSSKIERCIPYPYLGLAIRMAILVPFATVMRIWAKAVASTFRSVVTVGVRFLCADHGVGNLQRPKHYLFFLSIAQITSAGITGLIKHRKFFIINA
ncbi:hypothetical protein M8C21_005120, partial [Ambrosia artemisiifolia]